MFKKCKSLTPFILVSVLVSQPILLLADGKPSVAVVKFIIKDGDAPKGLGTAMSDILIHALRQTERYTVVDKSAIDKTLQEHKLVFSHEVDDTTGAKIGKLLDAQYLVIGTVDKFVEKKSGTGAGTKILVGLLGGKITDSSQLEAEVEIVIRIISSTTHETVLSQKISKRELLTGLAKNTSALGAPSALGLFKSAAMESAIDKATKDAVALIGSKIVTNVENIQIFASGVDFGTLLKLTNMLEKVDGIENVKKTFTGNVAQIQVQFAGTAEQLAEAIFSVKTDGLNFEIAGLSGQRIDLRMIK